MATKRTQTHLDVLKRFKQSGLKTSDLKEWGVNPWHIASLHRGNRIRPATLDLINTAMDKAQTPRTDLQTTTPMKSASMTPTNEDRAFAYFDAAVEIVNILERQPNQVRSRMIELVSKVVKG